MKKETYEKCMKYIEETPNGVKIICNLGKLFTLVTAFCYLFVLLGRILQKEWKEFIIYFAVSAVSFVILSIFRKCYNAQRPYEVYGFKPLLPKETKGKSFPSRHVFSIFVIGTSLLYQYTFVGVMILYMGCFLAVIRVVTGVHFPKDVLAGGIIGIICGMITDILLFLL